MAKLQNNYSIYIIIFFPFCSLTCPDIPKGQYASQSVKLPLIFSEIKMTKYNL